MISLIDKVVGDVNATDRDDPDTDHVKIKYKLLDGLDFFAIHPDTGVITTVSNKLDREVSTAILPQMVDFLSLHLIC